jgi:predicted DNA-binding ribbon-helix-helix protein
MFAHIVFAQDQLRYAARGNIVKTLIVKRSVRLDGHKTSISLEDEFWEGLCEIARRERLTISTLVKKIARARKSDNLSSAIRVFVCNHFRTRDRPKAFSNVSHPETPADRSVLLLPGHRDA